MWRRGTKSGEWISASCSVEGSIVSDDPVWVISVRRGRQRVDLFSGPLSTRPMAEGICRLLNAEPVERWDYLIGKVVPALLSGTWG